jgi:mediator of RNA polymerase II transcription subunit 31
MEESDGDSSPDRFHRELEFLCALAQPDYLHWLAVNLYFDDPSFVRYLKYLLYWNQPAYCKYVM